MANESLWDSASEGQDLDGHLVWIETCLWVFIGSAIFISGMVGNGLVMLVIAVRKRVQSTTNGLHLMCLAIADLLVLCTGMLRHLIVQMSDYNIRDHSQAACKIHLYLTYFATEMASWVLVHLTVERVAAVFIAHRVRVIFTQTRAGIALAINTVIIVALNVPYLWSFTLMEPKELGFFYSSDDDAEPKLSCDNSSKWQAMSNVLDWVHFAVKSAIPWSIMAAANAAIIVKIFRDRKQKRTWILRRSSGQYSNPTWLLLAMTTTFLVTTAPYSIYISLVNNMQLIEKASGQTEQARIYLLGSCFALLYYINNAINFVLYCLMGSRFRRELMAVFHRNRVSPSRDAESRSQEMTVTP